MEGPSLLILKQELQPFVGKRVIAVSGNTKQPKELLKGRKLESVQTWGKNLFLTFSSASSATQPIITKTHFLMFGSYRINEPRPDRSPRLELRFRKGMIDFYSCSIRFDADFEKLDRRVDLMSELWDPLHTLTLLSRQRDTYLCDLLLDQNVFAGSGNIVKNEVLFNVRRHPLTRLGQIDERDWPGLVQAVHEYCWNFYEWKKRFELRKHWQVYRQPACPLCHAKLIRDKTGKFQRRTFHCPNHQPLRTRARRLHVHAVLPIKRAAAGPEARLDH